MNGQSRANLGARRDAEFARGLADPKSQNGHPVTAAIFFVAPITAVLAGYLEIQGLSIHAFTSIFLLVASFLGVLTRRNPRPRFTLVIILLAVSWLLVTVVHLAFGDIPYSSEIGVSFTGLAIALGLAASDSRPRTYHAFFLGWSFAYAISVGVALLENYRGFTALNNLVTQQGLDVHQAGLASLFGNPNGFALFLLASSIVFYPWAIGGRTLLLRLFAVAAQASTLLLMLETESRIGLTLLAIVLVISYWNYLRNTPALRVFVLLVVVLFVTTLNANTSPRVASSAIFEERSLEIRVSLLLNAATFLGYNPLAGIGPDMFEQYIVGGFGKYETYGIINPHGGLGEIFSQYGIMTFVLYVAVFCLALRRACIRVRYNTDDRSATQAMNVAQLMLVATFPVASAMNSTFLGDPAAWLWLAGMVAFEFSQPADPLNKSATIESI